MKIGPTFHEEVTAAGLPPERHTFSVVRSTDEHFIHWTGESSEEDKALVDGVLAAHDPEAKPSKTTRSKSSKAPQS